MNAAGVWGLSQMRGAFVCRTVNFAPGGAATTVIFQPDPRRVCLFLSFESTTSITRLLWDTDTGHQVVARFPSAAAGTFQQFVYPYQFYGAAIQGRISMQSAGGGVNVQLTEVLLTEENVKELPE